MNFKNIQLLIDLIKQKSTGNPCDLAKKLAVSERMVYKYLDILKAEFNAPIEYSRSKQSYFFSEDGNLDLRWKDNQS